MPAILELRDAGLQVEKCELLRDISFDLQSGEILGIAGSNGAGKSSLLRLACGERPASRGAVLLHGSAIANHPPRVRARHLAILPQHSALQFDFSVEQVVALGFAPFGAVADAGVLTRVLSRCDLLPLRERLYPTLSGGEKQRVHLARVLLQLLADTPEGSLSHKALLLDEPTSAMDIAHQEHCLQLFQELRERGCAIALVMHDLSLLSRCSDRLLLLRQGRSFALGDTQDLLESARLSELYSYPIRLLRDADYPGVFLLPGGLRETR